jgi:site-specific DNA-methyltransferase (adenine-specific)
MGPLFLLGNALDRLDDIASDAIQTTITSPPYFHLRNYVEDSVDEIGREDTLGQYISHLADIFGKLLAKTRPDGTLFLNLGDTYENGSLLGVPWRVALEVANRGWILRSDIIWKKSNAMPSSVKNRPTVEHEYIFMFSKSSNYMYNQDAIREPHVTFTENSKMRGGRNHFGKANGTPENGKNGGAANLHDGRWDQAFHPLGRNKRTVWEIPLGKFRGEHFAVFPEKLVATCLLAGSNRGSLVCDPFMGSGTTGVVAVREDRDFIGIDINPEYIEMAQARISSTDRTLALW